MARVKTASKEKEILDAAARVFGQRPFHEVLIDDIASGAGIGKGTIYRYFETKDELYHAAILHGLDRIAAALEKSLSEDSSPTRRLERIALEILGFFWDRRYLLPFFQRDERHALRQDELLARRAPILRLVQETILSGIERREFRGIDAWIGAELFLGMIRSATLFHRDEDSIDDLVAHLMGIFVGGIGRRQP